MLIRSVRNGVGKADKCSAALVSLQARGPHQSGGNDQRILKSDFCITTCTLLHPLNTEIKAEV